MKTFFIQKYNDFLNLKNIKILFFFLMILWISIFLFYKKYYQNYYYQRKFSIEYEKILDLLNNDINSLQEIYQFTKNNVSIYSFLLKLEIIKILINKNHFLEAHFHLNQSLQNIKDPILKSILKLRIARIKIFQKNMNEAINILNSIQNNSWISLKNIFLGDAFLQKNNKKKAYKKWKEAIIYGSSTIFLKKIVEIKINNLQ